MSRIGIPGDTLSGNISGVGNRLFEIIRHGGFDGFETTVYAKGANEIEPTLNTSTIAPVSPPRLMEKVSDVVSHAWWETISVGRAANEDSIDLYFAPNYTLPLFYEGRSIIVVHDLIHEVCPEYLPKDYVLYMKAFFPRSVRNANRIIAVSESTKRDLLETYSVDESKIEVAYGSASDRFRSEALDESTQRKVCSSHGLNDEFILYVGNLEPRKNIHRIIEAVERLPPDRRPDIAIAGQEFHSYEELSKTYEESPIKDNVHFLGYVESDDLSYLYAGAELFVLPSFYEGFGLPLLEAMKAGTPVITSDRSSLPEVVGSGGITVDPTSTVELADQISRVLESDDVEWEKRAIDRADDFSWEKSAEEVNRIVSEVLEQ